MFSPIAKLSWLIKKRVVFFKIDIYIISNMWILFVLPKNLVSRLFGFLMHISWPEPLKSLFIQKFGEAFNINFDEAEKSVHQYKSIGDFFIRKLKPGLRPIGNALRVHPADSKITQFEKIKEGKLIQAKGKLYSLEKFIGINTDTKLLKQLENGFFATYYLCPTDYHRVHSPVTGEIKRIRHIPGQLWPVNNWSTDNIEELFCVNERLVFEIETSEGPVMLVMVGATNVGKMSVSFDDQITTNQSNMSQVVDYFYGIGHKMKKEISKGEELGMFHMGSTVVMVYSSGHLGSNIHNFEQTREQFLNKNVKMGQNLF
jgi:phosphatidylserine decarboxylase